MMRDLGRSAAADGAGARRQIRARTPAVEPLEGRALLSHFYSGLSATRPVQTAGGVDTVAISGPGLLRVQQLGRGVVGLTLLGTTGSSTLNITTTRQRLHRAASGLNIGSIRVVSGQLGGINASDAQLLGSVSPLSGQVNTLQFGGLGPNARIDIAGSVGTFSAGTVDLGPNGAVEIDGNVGQGVDVGSLVLDGGRFSVGNGVAGALSVNSLQVSRGGQLVVAGDVASAVVSAGASVTDNGLVSVSHNLGSLAVSGSLLLDRGGVIAVGNDLTGALTVGGSLGVGNMAKLVVGRDAPGQVNVAGDLDLGPDGVISVGRALNAVTVGGDLNVSPGGSLATGGNLTNLTVSGVFRGQGKGPGTVPDLNVGLNLGGLSVLGGTPSQGGLQDADIAVGKSLLGLNIPHGIFNSLITAGGTIQGGNASGGTGNVGPDGPDAVYNSQILAGVAIRDLTIGGNVRSTFAQNPASTGYPTRIVAGETRDGTFSGGGLIDNFQITGSLIDSVVAASVQPFGGNGTLPLTTYGAPPVAPLAGAGDFGFNTYDAPAGTITGGTVGAPVKYPNYTELSYYNETLTGVAWNTAVDPTIDDLIYPGGAINPSFASPPLPATSNGTVTTSTASSSTTTSGTSSTSSGGTSVTTTVASLSAPGSVLPLPTKPTVLGGVISTAHGDSADFAGLLAADTRGVFVGALPSS